MPRLSLSLLAAPVLAAGALFAPARAAPVVLELFTSQSCSSCPPADALLAELAANPDVLPLSFHVDYWDYLSWRDRFSLPEATARQRDYARRLGSDVYTPQLVVGGATQAVGSDREAVASLIAAARRAPAGPALTLRQTAGRVTAEIGAGAGDATLLLVGYDSSHVTRVGAGENGGRTLRDTNVVREILAAGDWRGPAEALTAARPRGDRVAALLQARDGRILSAAALP